MARRGIRDGSGIIGGLLLASLVLVGGLAWQAQDAARSHRAAAEAVLRDYAALAAEEFVRRSVAEVGYRGYFPLVNALGAFDAATEDPPSHAQIAAHLEGRGQASLDLVRYAFRFDPPSGHLSTPSPTPPPAVEQWLRDSLIASLQGEMPSEGPYAVVHGWAADSGHTAVFLRPDADGKPVLGFEVDTGALRSRFAAALEQGPLVPPSLAAGAVGNDYLSLQVADPWGGVLFAAGDPGRLVITDPYAPRLVVTLPYGDRYAGVFAGSTLQVALDPAAAPMLVIGGLPRSRLPILGALLGLTAGLLIAAGLLLRRARALARLRTDFVSRVSHELRTPLTQIRIFVETLRLGRVRSAAESDRALEIIDRESQRLGHLVENVLLFSRHRRGALRLAPAARPLAPLLTRIVEEMAPLLHGRATVVPRLTGGADAVVDDDALRQIVLNLLDNALKYGPTGQEIRLEAEAADTVVRIAVDDQGPGVPAAQRRRIWTSYHRLERDRRRAIAGTGIGLAVVRELVSAQGGSAWVEAGRRGGARFVVELPAAPATTPEAVPSVPAEELG